MAGRRKLALILLNGYNRDYRVDLQRDGVAEDTLERKGSKFTE